jgi:hypothetical protein
LRRDKHAFIWWSTCGGCFGVGWIRDLWRLPEYVNAANKNPGYLKDLNEKAKRYPSPTIVHFLFPSAKCIDLPKLKCYIIRF